MEGCRRRGDDPDPNRANYDETGIGTTSAVGCFPGGASPCGVEELSGNVWEWSRSLYRGYPYVLEDGREDLEADGRRVVRGGSFHLNESFVRCTYRDGHFPDGRWFNFGFRLAVVPRSL